MRRLPAKAIFLAVLCNILFGSAIPAIKKGYELFSINDLYSKILFAGIRFFISGILVLAFAAITKKKFPTVKKKNLTNVLLLALTYTFLQYLFNYIGLSNTSGSISSIITSCSSFISLILAHFIYKDDKINSRKLIGTLLGIGGVLLAVLSGIEQRGFSLFGEGFVFISAFCFVIGSVINKKATALDDNFTVTAYNLLIGSSLLIAVGLCGYKGGITVTPFGILILLHLVAVSSVGFTLWSILIKNYQIGSLGIFTCIIPISGGIISGILLGENIFSLKFILAVLLVSGGIFVINTKRKKRSSKTKD